MYRVPLTLLSVGLMLGGCVAAGPCDYNPASCYPQPQPQPYAVYPQPPPQPYAAYPQAEPYGYSSGPPPGQPYVGPDGLTYVDGYPVDVIDNQQVELVFVPTLGGWGYYDGERRWRGAPPDMRDRLDRFHPQGRGLPPQGGFRPGPGGPGAGPGAGRGAGPGRPSGPGYGGPNYGGPGRGGPGYTGQPGRPGPGAGPPPQASSRPSGPGPGGFGRPGGVGQPGGGQPPERRQPPPRRECSPGQPRCQ